VTGAAVRVQLAAVHIVAAMAVHTGTAGRAGLATRTWCVPSSGKSVAR
jgi:hypothetical protein